MFLQLIQTKQRLINIDETWLDSGDYRRFSWQSRKDAVGIPVMKISPNITLIAALDSKGKVYASFLQANSDNVTFQLYLKELIKILDAEDKNWRRTTAFVWDGAGYHKAKEVLNLLKEQQVPVMMLGPYMYRGAPVELLFAALKKTKLNSGD